MTLHAIRSLPRAPLPTSPRRWGEGQNPELF